MNFNKVKDVCKLGQYEKCCKYLLATSKGFECAKLTPLKIIIDKRKNMSAKADNCEGVETTKRQEDNKKKED